MKRLLVFLLCAFSVFLSCNDDQIGIALTSAEVSMNDNPESALKILESLDKDIISTRKQKAKYALLYSIALNKNYIDLQSDSIIAPAVKYYNRHGSYEERFLCYYHRALIYENAGDKENTILYAAKAASLDTSKVSAGNKCMLYALKGRVYFKDWRIKETIESYELACKYALESHKYRHYSYYCLELADAYKHDGDEENAMVQIRNAEKFVEYFTVIEKHLYGRLILLNMINSNINPDDCVKYAEQYVHENPENRLICWNVVAMAYLHAGNPDKAYEMLMKYAENYNISYEAQYHGVLSDVLEQLKDYKNALAAYKTFASLVKKKDAARQRSDVKLIEENFKNELVQNRQRYFMSYILGISLLLICLIVYMNIKWRKERRRNKRDLSDLQQEYEALMSLKERMEGTYRYLSNQVTQTSPTDKELMRVLGYRIKSLSAFLQKPVPDSLSNVASQINDLKKNKNYIVDSIGLLYAVTYPDFVCELRRYDLTSAEIGYCCLYLLGLNIPEAGEVIGKVSSIYNVNSSIRKKLGISGTNLDKWLVKRFTEICSYQLCETGKERR